jgi:hypothetical protein
MLILSANYRKYDRAYAMPHAIVYNETYRDNTRLSGRYLCKAPKCAPHLLGHKQKDILWIDASMRWTDRPLDDLFAQVPEGGVGIFQHRWRDCIYAEATASVTRPGWNRYEGEPIMEQVRHYRGEGHPPNWGLWETGILVWRGAQHVIGERWLAEQLVWTSQCQISLPYVLRQHGIVATSLQPGTVVDNPWFKYEEHQVKE